MYTWICSLGRLSCIAERNCIVLYCIALYCTWFKVMWGFDTFNTRDDTLQALTPVQYMGGLTQVAEALDTVLSQVGVINKMTSIY